MLSTSTKTPSRLTHQLVRLHEDGGDEQYGPVVHTNGNLRVIVDKDTGEELWRCPFKVSQP